jgi:ABC-type lipoprotein export system ATPase subunit
VPADEPIVALAGVSLAVSQGELVLVMGATGSGKSTLLQVAAGLLRPSSGVAEIDAAP